VFPQSNLIYLKQEKIQMKKMINLMLTLLIGSAVSANAQVNIGSENSPKPGAVLDLSQVSSHNLGLKLPVVSSLPTPSSDAKGLLVYSTTGAKGAGLYAWTGTAWVAYQPAAAVGVSLPAGVVATTDFTITKSSGTLNVGSFIPSNTSYKGVTWSVVSGNIVLGTRTTTSCVITSGTGVVRATGIDGQHSEVIAIN
jgi:hypothetical protein